MNNPYRQLFIKDNFAISHKISHNFAQMANRILNVFLKLSINNPFQPSVAFHIETNEPNDWFLYETQEGAEIV